MKKFLIGSLLLTGLVNADPAAERGWYYYEDPQTIIPQVESQPKVQYPSWTAYNDAVKREFEEIQDRARYTIQRLKTCKRITKHYALLPIMQCVSVC